MQNDQYSYLFLPKVIYFSPNLFISPKSYLFLPKTSSSSSSGGGGGGGGGGGCSNITNIRSLHVHGEL